MVYKNKNEYQAPAVEVFAAAQQECLCVSGSASNEDFVVDDEFTW